MTTLMLQRCEGLDTRQVWDVKDRFALAACSNIQIKPGGAITTRPALVYDYDVSSLSVGLYDRGGYLRAIAPSGGPKPVPPSGFVYDGIGNSVATDYSGKIGSVLVPETFGVSTIYGPHGYVSILRSDTNQIEHHWIQDPPAAYATYVATKIETLPFQPGRAMVKIANKITASDPGRGRFGYCSTLNGPTDWSTPGDAGSEQALQFVSGAREMFSLQIHRGLLAVFYEDAVQLWQMDTDPANIALRQILNGPGSRFPNSIVNIAGDIHFLGPAGFSNLRTATITGEATYGDIGDRIKTLTDSIAATATPVAVWSQRRSQWLIANGTTVFCFNHYALSEESSWTVWTLPVSVDYMTELNGIVYIRSGNSIYHLDDTVGRDANASADIAWSYQTRQMGWGKYIAQTKALRELVPQCSAAATYTMIVDGRTLTAARVIIPGSSSPLRAMLHGSGRRVAILASGNGLMQTDGISIDAEICGQ